MNITELDEWQGITEDMVRGWLLSQGWELTETGNGSRDAKKRLADRIAVFGCQWDTCLGWLLLRVAAAHAITAQAILREINPRMRKGMPSRAALEAHGENGDWVVFRNVLHAVRFVWTVCDAVQMVSGFDVFRGDNPEDAAMIAECSFWPCDKHGNKVRWPTDAEGNML
jgi:hypothetical protein